MINDRIRELDVFMRVASENSFSAAARALNVDPSTVSKLIQRIETRLGVRLFQRTSRSLRLTQEGERFLDGAQRVLEALDEAEGGVAKRRAQVEGVLRLNCSLAIARFRVLPVIPEVTARHPGLNIELILTTAPLDMFEHQIDLSLRAGQIPDSSFVARRIATSQWVTCAAPGYLARHGTPRKPEDLKAHNCLNYLPGSYRSTWLMRVGGEVVDIPVRGNIKTNSAELLCAFTQQGLGIARLPTQMVRDQLSSGELVQLLTGYEVDSDEPIYAVYPSKRHLAPRVTALLDCLDARQ